MAVWSKWHRPIEKKTIDKCNKLRKTRFIFTIHIGKDTEAGLHVPHTWWVIIKFQGSVLWCPFRFYCWDRLNGRFGFRIKDAVRWHHTKYSEKSRLSKARLQFYIFFFIIVIDLSNLLYFARFLLWKWVSKNIRLGPINVLYMHVCILWDLTARRCFSLFDLLFCYYSLYH